MNKMLRPALAFLAAVILLGMLLIAPKTKAEDPTRDSVSMLILYDDSYECRVAPYNITDYEERIDQMMTLAVIPFEETLGLTINYTIADYSSVLGTEYAMSCPDLYPLIAGNDFIREHHEWSLDEQCTCVDNDHCYTNDPNTCHHNSGNGLIHRMWSYALNSNYDHVTSFVGYNICYRKNNTHYWVSGLGQVNGSAFVCSGFQSMSSDTTDCYQVMNLLSMKGVLSHEFSHNLGLHDPGSTYQSNEPCIMAGGFDGIIFAKNIWCSVCMETLNPNGGE